LRLQDCDECREKLALMNAVQDVGDVADAMRLTMRPA
jgi:hypothetical protein